MKKIITIAMLLSVTAVASAKPTRHSMASRVSADHYAIPGEGVIRTVGCTVSAERMDVVLDDGPRPWLWFVDSKGEREGGCEVASRTKIMPVVIVKVRSAIHRKVATVASR